MSKVAWLSVIFSFFFFQFVLAQEKKDSIGARFQISFRNDPLQLNKSYISDAKDTLKISTLRFYISGMKVEYTDATVTSPKKKYALLDIENPATLQIPIAANSNKKISKITFNIGVDSLMSVSGAMRGDLDASNGMYWAWQSGYINMKIEGTSKSCKTRKNEFQFHIGGYLKPNYAMRTITVAPHKSDLIIVVDVAELFSKINLSETNSIMIPGAKAMEIADYASKMFRVE